MNLNNESKTLFIPLLAKAVISKKKLFFEDLKAEEIINRIDYDFGKLKQSNWLSMFLSVRASILDELCDKYLENNTDVTVIHLGCGLDSRYLRLKQKFSNWYDIDLENVIDLRKEYYQEDDKYKMIGSSVLDYKWLDKIKNSHNMLVIAEGLTMYLSENELKDLVRQMQNKFGNVHLIFDAYSKRGVKLSKFKNPVNQMDADIKYGIDIPKDFLKLNDRLEYINTYIIKNENNGLKGLKKIIFNHLYCGRIAQSIYKIYEFKLNGK